MKLTDLEKLKQKGLIRGFEQTGKSEKPNKYGAKKTEVDGVVFDSQREANRYIQLRYLLNSGEIRELQLQVAFELNEGGTHSLRYVADFTYYTKDGEYVVEDSKGFRTKEYRKKRKLMKEVLGIEVREV
jgi:hypothetical protein